jgi:hypothetical protein
MINWLFGWTKLTIIERTFMNTDLPCLVLCILGFICLFIIFFIFYSIVYYINYLIKKHKRRNDDD